MYKQLLEQIKKYDNITIFRHVRPDGDAVFSSLGLREFIKTNFKDKKVKLAGKETYDLAPKVDKVSDKFIKESLGIILDVSSVDRIDDNRCLNCASIFVVDHHPYTPSYTDKYYVEPKASATCELLTKILLSDCFKSYKLSSKTCEYLLCGILTDSNSFTTSNTTKDTLYYASKLVEIGDLKISDLNEFLFNKSLKSYKNITKFRDCLKIKNNVGYALFDTNDLKKINMAFDEVKNNVNEFSSIKDLKIWAVFAKNPKTGLYDGSIRSRRKYVINDICEHYNGGGHKNACGVKKLDKKQVNNLIADLVKKADK